MERWRDSLQRFLPELFSFQERWLRLQRAWIAAVTVCGSRYCRDGVKDPSCPQFLAISLSLFWFLGNFAQPFSFRSVSSPIRRTFSKIFSLLISFSRWDPFEPTSALPTPFVFGNGNGNSGYGDCVFWRWRHMTGSSLHCSTSPLFYFSVLHIWSSFIYFSSSLHPQPPWLHPSHQAMEIVILFKPE